MGFDSREVDDVVGGTRAHARRVLVTYLALTLLGVGALVALGVGAFDATLHAFASVSTGGFASHDGSLAVFPGRVRVTILALCFAGAVPLSLYYRTLYRHPRQILSDPQLRSLALLCALAVAALAGFQWLSTDAAVPLADLAVTAVSAQTTAGFSSIAMSELAPGPKLIVIASMFVGGGLGSTAGGIKIFRLLVCLRILGLLLDRISILRSGRASLRLGGDPVSPDEVEWVVGVVSAFGILVALSWLAFLTYGYAPLDSLFEVVSAVGTVGLSAGITSAELPAFLKGVLSLDMLMGRVEVVAFIVLLRPSTWLGRRRSFVMRIVFIGATGQVVESARSLLANGHEVVIVDAGEERLKALEEMGLDCGLVHGDGSRPAVLSELGPGNTDFLFCMTGSDQDNILAALAGKRLGFDTGGGHDRGFRLRWTLRRAGPGGRPHPQPGDGQRGGRSRRGHRERGSGAAHEDGHPLLLLRRPEERGGHGCRPPAARRREGLWPSRARARRSWPGTTTRIREQRHGVRGVLSGPGQEAARAFHRRLSLLRRPCSTGEFG